MTQSIYGAQFQQKNYNSGQIQNRIVFKALINKIINSHSNGYIDNDFKEFIISNFPVDQIYELSDNDIKERLDRLVYFSNLLMIDDISSLEIVADILKGMIENVIPKLIQKFPKYINKVIFIYILSLWPLQSPPL